LVRTTGPTGPSRREARSRSEGCAQPTGAIQLLTVAIDDDGAHEEFEGAFGSDPGLASELLLLANSAEFGFPARISSIGRAITLLGLERIRSLASRIAMSFYLRLSSRADIRAAWAHSLATAVLAEHIVAATQPQVQIYYTAGLLHDIGSLGLLLTSQEQSAELIARQPSDAVAAAALEDALFGLSHTEAGAFLADTWGFPAGLRACICDHHRLEAAPRDMLLETVQTACRLASALGCPEVFVRGRSESPEDILPAPLRDRRDFSADSLGKLVTACVTPSGGAAAPRRA
jgi:putative nucleotidyltransferase with HDIG domain